MCLHPVLGGALAWMWENYDPLFFPRPIAIAIRVSEIHGTLPPARDSLHSLFSLLVASLPLNSRVRLGVLSPWESTIKKLQVGANLPARRTCGSMVSQASICFGHAGPRHHARRRALDGIALSPAHARMLRVYHDHTRIGSVPIACWRAPSPCMLQVCRNRT